MEGKCYCCGKPGHKSTTCHVKDKPKPEWAINKAKLDNQSHLQAETVTNDDQISIHSNRDTQLALYRTIGGRSARSITRYIYAIFHRR